MKAAARIAAVVGHTLNAVGALLALGAAGASDAGISDFGSLCLVILMAAALVLSGISSLKFSYLFREQAKQAKEDEEKASFKRAWLPFFEGRI